METPMRSTVLALVLAACSAGSPAPVAAPPPSEAPTVPVTVAIDVLDGQPLAGGRMEFRARIVRHGVWTAPISVEFVVPRGAAVVGGRTQSVVASVTDEAPSLELQLAEVPADDLLLVARSETEAAGFTAKARYRFGRPDPVKTGPAKTGPRLTTPGGVDLGPAVPMKK
jgi:hypothetical protein